MRQSATFSKPPDQGKDRDLLASSPHLKAVVGVGALTARGLAGSDAQHLSGHAHRALDLELLVLGALDQVSAHCEQGTQY